MLFPSSSFLLHFTLLCLVNLESAVTVLEELNDLIDTSAAAVGVGLLGLGTRLDLAESAALTELGNKVSSGLGSNISSIAEGRALLHLGHEGSLVDNLNTSGVDENTVSSHLVEKSSVDTATGLRGERGVDGDDVASSIKLLERLNHLDAVSLSVLRLHEGIEGVNLHAEALGDAAHSTGNSTISLKTKLAATELIAALASEATTDGHDCKTKSDLSDSIGVLAGGVHDDDALGSAGREIDGIVASTSTNDDLKSRSVLKELSVDLIRTDDHGISSGKLSVEILTLGIALAENKLEISLEGLGKFFDLSNRVLGERLLSSNNDGMHLLLLHFDSQ